MRGEVHGAAAEEVPSTSPNRESAGRRGVATAVVFVIFAATGVGLTLPGTLLSPLLTRWGMGDERAGILFFVFFLGTSSGALLSRGRMGRSIGRGCGVASLGAAGLVMATHAWAFAAMACYGIGLGIAMTSVSVLQSRRRPESRTAAITRLNLIWAIGAFVGPASILRLAASRGLHTVLVAAAVIFAALSLCAFGVAPNPTAERSAAANLLRDVCRVPLRLLLFAPLATGVEAGVGSWLAAYSERSGQALTITVGAVSFFWGGLLLSRLAQSSHAVAAVSRRAVLLIAPEMIAAGLMLLIGSHQSGSSLAGALLVGLGVGPLYPLMLSLLLAHGEVGNAGFVLAGVGSSVLPLLTGLLSGWTGSLRIGLCVLLVAAASMAAMGVTIARSPEGLYVPER